MKRSDKCYLLFFVLCDLITILLVVNGDTANAYRRIEPMPTEKATEKVNEIVTGYCTFGDCQTGHKLPARVVEIQKILKENQTGEATEEHSSTYSQVAGNSQLLTEPETEAPEEPTEPAATEPEEALEPEPEEEQEIEPERSGRTVRCWVTAYCGCYECSEGYGNMTATGAVARSNHTIAVDPSVIPYGTQVEINGTVYTAEDCGGGVNGWEIDVYCAEHWQCEAWATGWYDVTIY